MPNIKKSLQAVKTDNNVTDCNMFENTDSASLKTR